jgi:hypothetical protein
MAERQMLRIGRPIAGPTRCAATNVEIACTPAIRPYRDYQKGIVDVFMFFQRARTPER